MFNSFKDKEVGVLGLGIEGKDAVNFLLKEGANVSILDAKKKEDLDLEGIDIKKVTLVTGNKYLNSLSKFDVIFRSPGVYRYKKELVEAEKLGVTITSALCVFLSRTKSRTVGVTGTKGKGTTSTLIYNMLKESGIDVYLAGNIGIPFLSLLDKANEDSIVVLELSSFQLIDLKISPNVSVVLNVTSDHMDWHESQKEYVNAKKNIVKYQKKDDICIVNIDYQTSRLFSKHTSAKVYHFSRQNKVDGSYISDNNVVINIDDNEIKVIEVDRIKLKGQHNLENVCASALVAFLLGAPKENIKGVLTKFKGLEHRLELVAETKGVGFYNDSFSTGPSPTIAGIKSFSEPITLIIGGYDKGLEYLEMFEEIKNSKNIKNIILIGDLESKFEMLLNKVGYKGKVIKMAKSNMKDIVTQAAKVTPKGGIVLLSPAAASFDMFLNYKERGSQFKDEVNKLKNG